jgi:hypothetical protein
MMQRMNSGIRFAAVSPAVLAIAFLGLRGQGHGNLSTGPDRGAKRTACANACSDCQRACDACVRHCIRMLQAGKQEHMAALRACQDCATFCLTASQIMARNGPFSNRICAACAEACSMCQSECEKYPDDALLKACANNCSACDTACCDMLRASDFRK